MKQNDAGPAFPLSRPPDQVGYGLDGMSLRDYFAGRAMQALIGQIRAGDKESSVLQIPDVSYKLADAMIKARME